MSGHVKSLFSTLETGRATAFFVAGTLWLIDTTLLVVELVSDISILGTPGPVNPLLYVSGTLAACVGLLGIYPALKAHATRGARITAGIVGIAGSALLVLLLWFLATTILDQPDPPAVLLILSILGVTLGIVCFGVLGVWTGIPSRVVGLLLLGIVATLVGGIVLVYAVYGGTSPDWTSPAIGVGVSVCLIGIGIGLRSGESASNGDTSHVAMSR